ncbi:MAG: DUF4380 domain-containing protein [Planctomycetota bacterium]
MKRLSKKVIALLLSTLLVQSCCSFKGTYSVKCGDKTGAVKKWDNYRGWNSISMSNGIIELNVVPEIGGRVVQYTLGDKEFFWVNPDLEGKLPTETGLTEDGGWLNYGGDKLWPAPQGWDNDQQWPGPPDAVLDGQPYVLEQLPEGKDGSVAVRLTSGNDLRSGISFSRVLRLHPDSTRVSIEATMTNIDNKPRRWGIWAHTQLDGAGADGKTHNSQMNAYCPINPKSHFEKGYEVIFGEADNPSFQPDYENNMMKVNYQYRVGKIGMDSDAGWIATVDGQTGDVFVHRFVYEPDKKYPDGSSVEFWHNGVGSIFAYNETMVMPDNPKENAYVFESEVLSPYANLEPGQQYTYCYQWYSAKIPSGVGVIDCTEAGVVCEPLTAKREGDTLNISGKFGVFYEGTISISAIDNNGNRMKTSASGIKVSPLERLDLNVNLDSATGVSKAATVSVSVFDKNEKLIGKLADAVIAKK